MFRDIYIELAQRLKTIPHINWVDLWANQTDYFDQELPFQLPAIFIEMNTNNINDLGGNIQELELSITFHIAVETLADSYLGSSNQNSALIILDYLVAVHQLIHGNAGTNYSRPRRTEIRQEINGGNILQYAVSYITTIRDFSANQT